MHTATTLRLSHLSIYAALALHTLALSTLLTPHSHTTDQSGYRIIDRARDRDRIYLAQIASQSFFPEAGLNEREKEERRSVPLPRPRPPSNPYITRHAPPRHRRLRRTHAPAPSKTRSPNWNLLPAGRARGNEQRETSRTRGEEAPARATNGPRTEQSSE